MTTLEAVIDISLIKGIGSNLYILTIVDEEDSEDTVAELWRADNEDHLYDLVKYVLEIDGVNHEEFEESWGMTIIPQFIGTIKTKLFY